MCTRSFLMIGVITAFAAVGCGGDEQAATIETVAAIDPSTTTTTEPDHTAQWCRAVGEVTSAVGALDPAQLADPVVAETEVADLVAGVVIIAELAPDEVSADTKVLRDGFVNFRDQLAEVDYDVASADLAALADAELHAASDAIISYSATVCDPASD